MKIIFVLLLTIVSSIKSSLPTTQTLINYHQEYIFPSSKSYADSSTLFKLESGFGFKRPQLKSLPSLGFFEAPQKFKGPPIYPLFTPNTFNQRPETVGQIEEYKKALQEEAEEKAKENELNEVSTFGKLFNDETSKSTHYVNVQSDGFNYKYRI